MARAMAAASRFAFPLFLLGSIVLSAGPLFVRLADVGEVQSAFWRLAIGAPLLFLLVRATASRDGAPARPPRITIWLILGGIFFAGDLAVWHLGITRTAMANSTLVGNSAAFLFPVWGYLTMRRWPTKTAGFALAMAACGIALLAGQSASISREHLTGDLLCLVAAIFYTAYLIVMDKGRQGHGALPALAFATLVGAIVLFPLALIAPGAFWPTDWTPLLLLALSSQVLGQGLIIYALPQLPPVASGVGLLIQPAFSGLLGYLWFGEVLALADIAGIALIFTAILIVRRPSAAQPEIEKRVPPSLGGAQIPD